ncbi:MAG: phospholipase D family protein [Longimicrobiales bacterium]
MNIYFRGDEVARLGDLLTAELAEPWTSLRAAIAYAKLSGVDHVYAGLKLLSERVGTTISLSVGIDQHGTSFEALDALRQVLTPAAHHLYVCHNPRSSRVGAQTFHPKVWLLARDDRAVLVVGSGNLTGGGLYTNAEAGVALDLDLGLPEDQALRAAVEEALDRWSDPTRGDVVEVDEQVLRELRNAGLVLTEAEMRRASRAAGRARVVAGRGREQPSVGSTLFAGEDLEPAPEVAAPAPRAEAPTDNSDDPEPASVTPSYKTFRIHLSKANKTEIYLAQAPLRDDPAFFGLPFTGRTSGAPPQPQADPWPVCDVTVQLADGTEESERAVATKIWRYMEGKSANKDVRIYFGADLQRGIEDGSILVMERVDERTIDYRVTICAPGHPEYDEHEARCTIALPNSSRRYGWEGDEVL